MSVILNEERMAKRSVEKSHVKRKTILDLVSKVTLAVEVERGQIASHIHSDVHSLGNGYSDKVDRGRVFLVGSYADVETMLLFRSVNGDVAVVFALEGCSRSADCEDRLVRVFVQFGVVEFKFEVGQQWVCFVKVNGEVRRAGEWEKRSSFVVPSHWNRDVRAEVQTKKSGAIEDVCGAYASLRRERKAK